MVVARGGGSKSVQNGIGTSGTPGALCGEVKNEGKVSGKPTERETRFAAAWNAEHRSPAQVQRLQGKHFFRDCALLQEKMEASQKTNSSRWKHARASWRDGSLQ